MDKQAIVNRGQAIVTVTKSYEFRTLFQVRAFSTFDRFGEPLYKFSCNTLQDVTDFLVTQEFLSSDDVKEFENIFIENEQNCIYGKDLENG